MKTSQGQLLSIVFLLLTTLTAAWPWPRWLPEYDTIVARQDNKEPSEPASTPTRAPTSAKPTNSGEPSVTRSGTASGAKETGTESNTRSGSRTSSKPRTTAYDPTNPAGAVAMITPAITEGSQYFKIGDYVTFAWNYTNLLATPTAVNIVASCSANNQIYTIAANHTVANSTQSVVWDTGNYMQTALASPLLTEKYTLIIYDAQSSISANAQPGYLAVFNQYTFGMYVKQAYTPLGEWKCSTCSGALSDMERRALGMVVGVGVVTVLSFTWFVSGTGIIW